VGAGEGETVRGSDGRNTKKGMLASFSILDIFKRGLIRMLGVVPVLHWRPKRSKRVIRHSN
jgi:hypothetical protein